MLQEAVLSPLLLVAVVLHGDLNRLTRIWHFCFFSENGLLKLYNWNCFNYTTGQVLENGNSILFLQRWSCPSIFLYSVETVVGCRVGLPEVTCRHRSHLKVTSGRGSAWKDEKC